jgi:hypothetical protein
MLYMEEHYEIYCWAKHFAKELALLFRSPGSGTQRLIGIAKKQRIEYLINGDQKLKDIMLHTGHARTGKSGSISAYDWGAGLVPA